MTIPDRIDQNQKIFLGEVKEYAKRIKNLNRSIESLKSASSEISVKTNLKRIVSQVASLRDHLTQVESRLKDANHPLSIQEQNETERMMSFFLPKLQTAVERVYNSVAPHAPKKLIPPEKTFKQELEGYKSRLDSITSELETLSKTPNLPWYTLLWVEKVTNKVKELRHELHLAEKGIAEGTITLEDKEVTTAMMKFMLASLPKELASLAKSIKSAPPSPRDSSVD